MRLSILGLLLFGVVSTGYGLTAPDTTKYIKKKAAVVRKSAKIHSLTLPNGHKCILIWRGDTLYQVRYQQTHPFSNKGFSKLAHRHGDGASWHEIPLTQPDKNRLIKRYPGLEQQWVLRGFENRQCWMGSGIVSDTFFLVFSESSPTNPAKPKGPLKIQPEFYNSLNTSEQWLPVNCNFSATSGKCYQSVESQKFRVYIPKKKSDATEIWILEKHDLSGIASTLNQSTPEQHHELSKELASMAQIESHSALTKLFHEVPYLFTWNSWQLEDAVDGAIKAPEYLKRFKQSKNSWQSLPVYKYIGEKLNIHIFLFFNGHYKIKLSSK